MPKKLRKYIDICLLLFAYYFFSNKKKLSKIDKYRKKALLHKILLDKRNKIKYNIICEKR